MQETIVIVIDVWTRVLPDLRAGPCRHNINCYRNARDLDHHPLRSPLSGARSDVHACQRLEYDISLVGMFEL
jgi:hypothetical protein